MIEKRKREKKNIRKAIGAMLASLLQASTCNSLRVRVRAITFIGELHNAAIIFQRTFSLALSLLLCSLLSSLIVSYWILTSHVPSSTASFNEHSNVILLLLALLLFCTFLLAFADVEFILELKLIFEFKLLLLLLLKLELELKVEVVVVVVVVVLLIRLLNLFL